MIKQDEKRRIPTENSATAVIFGAIFFEEFLVSVLLNHPTKFDSILTIYITLQNTMSTISLIMIILYISVKNGKI